MEWTYLLYPWLKAAHIIFVIFWMAGLFMLPRFFVYHQESGVGSREEQAWIERGAWGYLSGSGLVALAAIMLGIDGDARVASCVRALLPTTATELSGSSST